MTPGPEAAFAKTTVSRKTRMLIRPTHHGPASLVTYVQVWWTGEGTQPNQQPPRLDDTTLTERADAANGAIFESCLDHEKSLVSDASRATANLLHHAALAVRSNCTGVTLDVASYNWACGLLKRSSVKFPFL